MLYVSFWEACGGLENGVVCQKTNVEAEEEVRAPSGSSQSRTRKW